MTDQIQHNGINLSDLSRYDAVLVSIKNAIKEIAPAAKEARDAENKKAIEEEKKANPVFKLPPELRRYILDLIIDPIATPIFIMHRRLGHYLKPIIPAIACAFTLQNRLECMAILLEKSTLEIRSGPGLTRTLGFLQAIDFNETAKNTSYDTGFDCVRSLVFPYFSRYPHAVLGDKAINKDIMLMRMCKNLFSVKLTFVDEELICWGKDGYEVKAIERIRREYRLDLMLGLKKLTRLRLVAHDTDRILYDFGMVGVRQVRAIKA